MFFLNVRRLSLGLLSKVGEEEEQEDKEGEEGRRKDLGCGKEKFLESDSTRFLMR